MTGSKEIEAALAAKAICVDVFALFTLRLLKHLDLLPKLYPNIFVHTAIFEAIVANIREMESRNTTMTIGYHEGRLVRSEAGPVQIAEQLSFLRDIRDFLKSDAVKLVGLDGGALSNGDIKTATKVFGVMYYEPILVSKSRDVVYYADDAPLRLHAGKSHAVASFCTQALLRVAKEKKFLTDSQYEDATITLLRHNYHFVSESAETLARLVELEGFQPSELAKTMLGRVADPKVDQSTAIRILSDFCLFVWRADLSKTKGSREVWLELCVDSILLARQPDSLFVYFLANLAGRALTQPADFGGITNWIVRNGRFSKEQRQIFYIAVQEAMVQMKSLARREYEYWPSLQSQWWQIRRLNLVLDRNGWILRQLATESGFTIKNRESGLGK